MIDPRLAKLPARAPRDVLGALVQGDKPVPRVTIHVGDVALRKCKVLRVEDKVVMVADADGDGAWDVHYVVPERITHVVVHASADDVHAISFGELRARTGSVPTALELRRRALILGEEIGKRTSASFSIDLALDAAFAHEQALFDLADLLSDLRDALFSATQDEEGIAALRGRVSRARLDLGPRAAIAIEGDALRVTAVLDSGALSFPRDLRSTLESLL